MNPFKANAVCTHNIMQCNTSCRYTGVSEEEYRLQMSLYKSLREDQEVLDGEVLLEDAEDDDYVKATRRNRCVVNSDLIVLLLLTLQVISKYQF